MLSDTKALTTLTPAYARSRDLKAGGALQELLSILGGQAEVIERDIERMYDNWFIETCEDWVVPYIADLLGYDIPALLLRTSAADTPSAARLRAALAPRREVANLIAHRRRKGTAWLLEELSRDVAGWPSRAVEFFRHVCVFEHLDHSYRERPALLDLHDASRMEHVDDPFDTVPHTYDVRRAGNADSPGRHSVPAVLLFACRLREFSVTRTSAYCNEDAGSECFAFSPLGQDTQLFRKPERETVRTQIADEANLPLPIRRFALEAPMNGGERFARAAPEFAGEGRSFAVRAVSWSDATDEEGWIQAAQIIPTDLSEWSYEVPRDHVALDPVRGRLKFPADQLPEFGVQVSYHYGFPAEIGGGEYARPALAMPTSLLRYRVVTEGAAPDSQSEFASIAEAFAAWRKLRDAGDKEPVPAALLIELPTSDVYRGPVKLQLKENETVVLAAASRTRPVIWLSDETSGMPDGVTISGTHGSRVLLDGVLIAGRGVEISARRAGRIPANEKPPLPAREDPKAPPPAGRPVPGDLCEVVLHHVTLVPGWGLTSECEPKRTGKPSLVMRGTGAALRVDSSIIGAIQVVGVGDERDALAIDIEDSIVDAISDDRVAIGGDAGTQAYAALTVRRSTLVGQTHVHAIVLAENSIFAGVVRVSRRQIGCVRFCYVAADSRTPRRYRCQPDMAVDAARAALPKGASVRKRSDAAEQARMAVRPRFESVRYGNPRYLRLTECAPLSIREGAEDESEMGVYHDLYEPQRRRLLQARLQEHVPADADGALVFMT